MEVILFGSIGTLVSAVETKLQAAGIRKYDEDTRAYKLLETARLDFRTKQNSIATAGHVYDFFASATLSRYSFPSYRTPESFPLRATEGKRRERG